MQHWIDIETAWMLVCPSCSLLMDYLFLLIYGIEQPIKIIGFSYRMR